MSTTPLGQRQNLQYREIANGGSHTFTVDREHRIDRVLILPTSNPSLAKIRIQCEGELLFNGQFAKVCAVAIQTDDANTLTNQRTSPYVLRFDRLVTLSREFPITVEVTGTECAIALMGP